MKRAVFLDLNGTLVDPVRIESLAQLAVIPGALEAVAALNEAGFICPVITVQSRIAKRYFTEAAFYAWFVDFAAQASRMGASLLGPYVCPHAFAEPCICKKPQTHLYLQAARDHQIDVSRSYVAGDTASDLEAGVSLGAKSCLVWTGWGHFESNRQTARITQSLQGANLSEIASVILSLQKLE